MPNLEETPKIGFNPNEEEEETLTLNVAEGEAPKADTPPSPKSPIDFNMEDVLPFIEGFLGSLGRKKEEAEKTVNNTDYSSNESTRNVHFTFNFGDVRIHTAK